jgi:hypothetical protein
MDFDERTAQVPSCPLWRWFGHDHHVTGVNQIKHPNQFGPVPLGTRIFLFKGS